MRVEKKILKKIRKKAKERDYNFEINELRIYSHHINNAPRYKRTPIFSNPNAQQQVIKIVTKDRNGKEKSAEIIIKKLIPKISRQTVCKIIKILGFKKIKKIIKPGLNEE